MGIIKTISSKIVICALKIVLLAIKGSKTRAKHVRKDLIFIKVNV